MRPVLVAVFHAGLLKFVNNYGLKNQTNAPKGHGVL